MLLEVDTYRPLEIVASFRTVLQYAWPGGLGGQYAFWSADDRAFVLSESLRRRNALIGSPWATAASTHPAHALPDAPSTFTIPIDPARAAREMVPIAIVAGTAPREEIAATYRRVLSRAPELYAARRRHAEALREDGLRIDTPEDRLDLALEWAKVNLDEQRVCNPDLGCGLVAGWGPSGEGARPGFGWFFGGDAAINSLAMAATGQWAEAAEGLRFLAKYQRADGKIPHEVSQSAGVVPWFEEYPYAYYHADTTPFWLLALWQAVEGERGPGAPRRALAGGAEGVGLVPAPRHGRRRDHREHDRRPGGDRGGVDRRGHPPGRLPGRGVDARGGRDGRDGGGAGRGRPRGAGAGARVEGPGLDRVALLDRERRAPRLRGAALGSDERHAHRVAGHGGGVRLSSSPPTPAARSRRSRPTR